ncbi:hypothetical protein F5B18DRAFT_636906 [Nemania serpens]|nr:hypothetical protein F5B18DRAFT_636906 [Nemania serpens]
MLNDSSVSDLAAILIGASLYVYCVSGGTLHSFYRSTKDKSSRVEDSRPSFPNYPISGTPAVASSSQRWDLVVPCQSDGLLHTSTNGSLLSRSYPQRMVYVYACRVSSGPPRDVLLGLPFRQVLFETFSRTYSERRSAILRYNNRTL